MPKAKLTQSRPSGIGNALRKSMPAKKVAATPLRKSAPADMGGQEETKVDAEDQVIGGGFNSIDEIHDALPSFLKPENLKDKHGNRPDHPEYDYTTLHIPQNSWKDFTPAMSQYWKLKVDNFEKVFFFKLGKFYEIFFADAILC